MLKIQPFLDVQEQLKYCLSQLIIKINLCFEVLCEYTLIKYALLKLSVFWENTLKVLSV